MITLKARSADTDGTSFALLEEKTPPQGGPTPHILHQEDEALYVLGGELEFLVDERTMRASAGSFFYVPGGTLHTFKNVGTEGASAPEGPPDV